ncbi:MAG: oxygen-dependent coproporphyrinogen oxidase [Saprospiraceae bacterium]|nr:oxygen-dependent coproporphyrinogen oxidase [Saprospiraceae bacterium]
MKERFVSYIHELQNTICAELERIDGKAKFVEDAWERPGGGGGKTRVITNGNVLEKGGVNTSIVHGQLPELMKQKFGVEEANFFACGISLVLHPKNPFAPTSHANWRYFEMYNAEGKKIDAWFGGGLDLTPYYLFEEDAQHWHQVCKNACDKHHSDFYTNYKKWCDDYFHNSHRNEARGIGGLFFDYLKDGNDGLSHDQWYDFVTEVGDSFLPAYLPILEKRKDLPFNAQNRYWQEIRRGRYVEFNLIHDRGTLFGLKTNGRIESILMSLPPQVRWDYNLKAFGPEEEKLMNVLVAPKEWIVEKEFKS